MLSLLQVAFYGRGISASRPPYRKTLAALVDLGRRILIVGCNPRAPLPAPEEAVKPILHPAPISSGPRRVEPCAACYSRRRRELHEIRGRMHKMSTEPATCTKLEPNGLAILQQYDVAFL